jgi:hypothetical protein
MLTLPIPEYCDCCCSTNIEFVKEDRNYYICLDCGASTGCHAKTNIPFGKLADKQVRILRIKAHLFFDRLWKSGLINRSRAYAWLSEELKIEENECHISWLTKDQLIKTAIISKTYFEENQKILNKRKVKQHVRIRNKRKRIAKCIERRKSRY